MLFRAYFAARTAIIVVSKDESGPHSWGAGRALANPKRGTGKMANTKNAKGATKSATKSAKSAKSAKNCK